MNAYFGYTAHCARLCVRNIKYHKNSFGNKGNKKRKFSLLHRFVMLHNSVNQESVVSPVIQATWTGEFEDSLQIGNQLKARNGLKRIKTLPDDLPGTVCKLKFLWGRLSSNLIKFAWLAGLNSWWSLC